MTKTLVKHGNSLALIIDKPILELLRISDDTPLDIFTDGQSLMITPILEPDQKKAFEKSLAKLHKGFGRAMKRLAE